MAQVSSHTQEHSDYHGHPNYFAVWITLMILMFGSLMLAELGSRVLAISLIFSLAIVKAILVLGQFMHLKWEPRMLWGIVAFGFLCLIILYFGVFPDIVMVKPHIVK